MRANHPLVIGVSEHPAVFPVDIHCSRACDESDDRHIVRFFSIRMAALCKAMGESDITFQRDQALRL